MREQLKQLNEKRDASFKNYIEFARRIKERYDKNLIPVEEITAESLEKPFFIRNEAKNKFEPFQA